MTLHSVRYLCFAFFLSITSYSIAQQCDSVKLNRAQQTFTSMLVERKSGSENLTFTQQQSHDAAVESIRESAACYLLLPEQSFSGPIRFELFPYETKRDASDGLGISGGTVSYSFLVDKITISDGGNTNINTAIASLNNYQIRFTAEIAAAFTAWSAVADIGFVEVADNGFPTNNPASSSLIRIGGHAFDSVSYTLAHAWAPLLQSQQSLFPDAGDMHFGIAENRTCEITGIDIGIVAVCEIGHSIGLVHSDLMQSEMAPVYNPSLSALQQDDVNGAVTLYGERVESPVLDSNFIFLKHGDYLLPILKPKV